MPEIQTEIAGGVTVVFTVPFTRVADLLCTAIESGGMSRAWCAGVYWQTKAHAPPTSGPWYANPEIFEQPDFKLQVDEIIDETKFAGGKNLAHHFVDIEAIKRGLSKMAQDHPGSWTEFMLANEDEVVGDVFLQLIALGEVRYG